MWMKRSDGRTDKGQRLAAGQARQAKLQADTVLFVSRFLLEKVTWKLH